MSTSSPAIPRTFTGVIESNRMKKTLVVRVDRTLVHPKYGKRYVRSQKFHVHAEDASAYKPGDQVSFRECRPLSRTKRWIVIK